MHAGLEVCEYDSNEDQKQSRANERQKRDKLVQEKKQMHQKKQQEQQDLHKKELLDLQVKQRKQQQEQQRQQEEEENDLLQNQKTAKAKGTKKKSSAKATHETEKESKPHDGLQKHQNAANEHDEQDTRVRNVSEKKTTTQDEVHISRRVRAAVGLLCRQEMDDYCRTCYGVIDAHTNSCLSCEANISPKKDHIDGDAMDSDQVKRNPVVICPPSLQCALCSLQGPEKVDPVSLIDSDANTNENLVHNITKHH